MANLRILLTRPSLVFGALDMVLFATWTHVPARSEDLLACIPVAVQYAKTHKQCGQIVVVHPDQGLPDAALRKLLQTEMRKLDPYLLCGATVLLRQGLPGVAMRAVTSTIQLLSRPTHPERIVASGTEATNFVHEILSRRLEKAPSAAVIGEAFQDFTRRAWLVAP